MPVAARYLLALLLVAGATVLAFICEASGIGSQTLTLAFVVPVAVAGAYLGWGPAFLAVAAGALSFDFFFTQPLFTLNIASRSDIAAVGLLAVVAAIVSTVSAETRRRSLEAQEAAVRAEALRELAHAVIHEEADATLFAVAAEALARIFKAPAVIYSDTDGVLATAAKAGGAAPSPEDRVAAQWASGHNSPIQGDTYPFDTARFDLWPVTTSTNRKYVLGVDFTEAGDGRPADRDKLMELVAGYLAAALGRKAIA